MVVRAPFDGMAISKDAQPGEMISPVSAGGGFTRTGICTIVDMSSLEIEVDVSETYINRVACRPEGRGGARRVSGLAIPAHVITTIPSADRQKATVKVRIGFDALDPRILPDMGVKVSFLQRRAAGSRQARTAPRMIGPEGGDPDASTAGPSCSSSRTTTSSGAPSASATRTAIRSNVLSGVTRRRARRARRAGDDEGRRQDQGAMNVQ